MASRVLDLPYVSLYKLLYFLLSVLLYSPPYGLLYVLFAHEAVIGCPCPSDGPGGPAQLRYGKKCAVGLARCPPYSLTYEHKETCHTASI